MSAQKNESKKEKDAPASDANRQVRLTPDMIVENAQADSSRLEMTNRQLRDLQQIQNEMAGAVAALTELQKSAKGEAMLVPLGSGVFIEASVSDPARVKMGLSGSVMVDRSAAEALEKIKQNQGAVQKDFDVLSRERDRLMQNLTAWQNLMNQIRERQMQAGKTPQNG